MKTPSPIATRASERIRQLIVSRLKLHPESCGGFADEAAAIIDEELKPSATALSDASEHLDYCGYGDSWERECATASKLSDRLVAAIADLSQERAGKRKAAR